MKTQRKSRQDTSQQNGTWVAPLTVSPATLPAPPGWQWHLLRDLARLESGHTPSRYRPDWWGGDIPWLALPDIRKLDGQVVHATTEYTNKDGIANSSARILPAGTVCLSRTASVGFVTKLGRPMATSQDFVNWVCGPDLDPDFLLHLLIAARDCIREQSSGAIHKTVYVPTVKAFRVCAPPLAEQKRIAGILKEQMAAVERARAAAQAQLEAAQSLPAAYMREVFDSAQARKWPRVGLKVIASIRGGVQKTPARNPVSFHRPYLTVRNVQRGYLDLSQLERFELSLVELDTLRLQRGDLLIVEGNGSLNHIGRNAIFEGDIEDCVHQNHIIRVRLDSSRASPRFVSRYLNSPAGMAQMIEKAQTTSGLFSLSAEKVSGLTVPLPPIDVQDDVLRSITEELAVSDRLIAKVTEQIEFVDGLSSAFLRQAFRGKL